MSAAAPLPPPPDTSPFLRVLAEQAATRAASLPDGDPGWLAARRRDALQSVLDQGLPGPREERWRSTPLRALQQRGYALPDAGAPSFDAARLAVAGLDGPRLVFVNGRFSAALSTLGGLPPGVRAVPLSQRLAEGGADPLLRRLFGTPPDAQPADAFVRLNAALASDGVLLQVAPGTQVEQPVQLVFAGAATPAPVLWSLRHLVELGEGAALTLVERWLDEDAGAHLGNVVTQVALGAQARLVHVRLQQGAAQASSIARTDVAVAAGAAYCPVALELGGALSRHEWNVSLDGEGACATLRGVVLAAGRQQMDTRYGIVHAVGATRSDTLWRAIAGGRARSAFHGGIRIAAGADGSDAALETRNLLLSDTAVVDAQPVLEIEADEVKASHGATVGQLDAAALFYLRTRGIPEREARHLLVQAFCAEVLERAGCGPCSAEAATEAAADRWQALRAAIADRLAGIGELA